MTPAQRKALTLLATPGAEAHPRRSIRWSVVVDGNEIGTIYSPTLLTLRLDGLVERVYGLAPPHALVLRITESGRAAAGGAP